MASQIIDKSNIYLTHFLFLCKQQLNQSSELLAVCEWKHNWKVNSPTKQGARDAETMPWRHNDTETDIAPGCGLVSACFVLFSIRLHKRRPPRGRLVGNSGQPSGSSFSTDRHPRVASSSAPGPWWNLRNVCHGNTSRTWSKLSVRLKIKIACKPVSNYGAVTIKQFPH